MTPSAYVFDTATEALPALLHEVLQKGDHRESRNGDMLELTAVQIQLTLPQYRYQVAQDRKASLPAQIAESAWILSGRNDVDWLTNYLPQAKRFSDDGETWRGGYGPRLRAWPRHTTGGIHTHIDQLQHVVDMLKRDPDSRRAIMSIYNPAIDVEDGLDIPCNQYVQFMVRDDLLHMFVSIRSNDLMWGWSGINTFEWSVVQQAVAEILGVDMGPVTYSIASLHLYERHWEKAERIVEAWEQGPRHISWDTPAVFSQDTEPSVAGLDQILRDFFETEQAIREGGGRFSLPDSPLFHQWLLVLEGWWKGDATENLSYPAPGLKKAIWTAAHESPANKQLKKLQDAAHVSANEASHIRALANGLSRVYVEEAPSQINPAAWVAREVTRRVSEEAPNQNGVQEELPLDDYKPNTVIQDRAARQEAMKRHPSGKALHHVGGNPLKPSNRDGVGVELPSRGTELRGQTFAREVSKLHEEKHAAYGDSWKRRGEMLGIMANIARKVDRLGADGGGDTATDTAIDLLVYLIKYDLWIMDETGNVRPPVAEGTGKPLSEGEDHTWHVRRYLQYLAQAIGFRPEDQNIKTVEQLEGHIRASFSRLEKRVMDKDPAKDSTVDALIVYAYKLAIALWATELDLAAAKDARWKAGNATRRWAGYDNVDEEEDTE